MPQTFGALLAECLTKKDLSHRAFARLVGSSNGFVSQVIRGERLPPPDLIPAWAETLGLDKAGSDELWLHANLAHCPAWMREKYLKMAEKEGGKLGKERASSRRS
jgi:transcriptional regulator with XRE-family HTH domain